MESHVCVCLCDYIVTKLLTAVNIHACYIWIVNDITDSNTGLFSVSFFFFFFFKFCFGIVCVRKCVSVCVCSC